MPSVDLTDEQGNHFKVLDVDGFYLPQIPVPTQEESFREIKDSWLARDDDIMICNYPKSGTHWIWEIIQLLYKKKAEFVDSQKEEYMIEFLSKEELDSLPSPRILNTHVYFSMLPKDFIRRKCKIVYTIRNPKDVAVSFYHHHRNILLYQYTGRWEDYLGRFLDGRVDYMSWFDYVRNWDQVMKDNPDYPIHLIHYENMKQIDEIRKLADFLGIKYDEKLLNDVVEKCKFEEMKNGKSDHKIPWRENSEGMYRKGLVGDWKNVFTVAQNETFDRIYTSKMKDIKLNLKFSDEKQ